MASSVDPLALQTNWFVKGGWDAGFDVLHVQPLKTLHDNWCQYNWTKVIEAADVFFDSGRIVADLGQGRMIEVERDRLKIFIKTLES